MEKRMLVFGGVLVLWLFGTSPLYVGKGEMEVVKVLSAENPQNSREDMAEAVETVSEKKVSEAASEEAKVLYLTFDDGPSGRYTDVILDILKERNVKATFFLIGKNVCKYPETARRIAEEGHAIGIHCNWHDYHTLYADTDSYVADFELAEQAIREVIGVETKLFRFPGGSINAYNQEVYEAIITEMTARGYLYYDWNASLEDAVSNPDPKQLIENAVSSTLGRKKIIMLAHDGVKETALCLNELLDQFPEYEMLPLTEEVSPIQF